MSALLAMLQVNIALGLLYIGLKEHRYRERLFNAIVDGCNSKDVSTDLAFDSDPAETLRQDSGIAETYHKLAMWFAELPGYYLMEINNDTAISSSPRPCRKAK